MNKLAKNQYALAVGKLMAGPEFLEKVDQKTKIIEVKGFDGKRLEAFTKDIKTLRSLEEDSAYQLVLDLLSLGVLGYSSQEEKLTHYPQDHSCQRFSSIWLRDKSVPIVEPSLRNILFQRLSIVSDLKERYKWKDKKGATKLPNLAKAIKTSMFGGNNNALDNFFGYVYTFKELSKDDLIDAFNLQDVPKERVDALHHKLKNFEAPAFLAEENFRAVRNQLVAMIASWTTKNISVIEGFLATSRKETAQSKAAVAKAKKEGLPTPEREFVEVPVHTQVAIPERAPKNILDRKNFDWAHFGLTITKYNAQLLNAQAGVRALVESGITLSQEAIEDISSIRETGDEMVTLFSIINGELRVEIRQHILDIEARRRAATTEKEANSAATTEKEVIKNNPQWKLHATPTLIDRFSAEIEKADEVKYRSLQLKEYEETVAKINELTKDLDLDKVRFDAQTFNQFIRELLALPDAYKGIVIKDIGATGAVEKKHLQWKAFGVMRYFKDGNDVDTSGGMLNEKKAKAAGLFDTKKLSRFEPSWFKHDRSTRKWEPLPIAHLDIPVKALLTKLLEKAQSESIGTEGKIRKIMATTASLLLSDSQARAALCRVASKLTSASSLYQYRSKAAFTYRAGHLNFYRNGADFGLAIATKEHLADEVSKETVIRDCDGALCNPRNVALFSLAKTDPAFTQIIRDILDGKPGIAAKGFTLVIENLGSSFERALVQIPFVDSRHNSMNLNFKHIMGIDVNMHNIAYAIANPHVMDENGNPQIVERGLVDCQVASQMDKNGRKWRNQKQMANSLRGNDGSKAPLDRHANQKKKASYAGFMIGQILELMFKHQALPVFERGIGQLQKGREMEALWNDVVTAFVGGLTDADLKRRNQTFGVSLGGFHNHHFFPNLPGSAAKLVDKVSGKQIGWARSAFNPGMTTNHEHTSQRCHHCEVSVREWLQSAVSIKQINEHEVQLGFADGVTANVGFENELPKIFGRNLEAIKYELKKLAKWQQRVQPKNRTSTDSRFAQFRCFNLACDHNYPTARHVEHADINAAINITRNGFQQLLTPMKDVLVAPREKETEEEPELEGA